MKPEIKQRIEQINNGIVPDGYKKTTVGIVPLEWAECTIGDFLEFKNGLNKEKEAFGKGTPIVNYTDVWKKRGIRANDIKGRVELTDKEIETYEAREGDIFFTRTSETANEIGLSSVLLENVDNAVFSGFLLRGRPCNDTVVKEYHQYCYSSNLMRHEIIRRSSMTTRALTSGPMLKQVKINLPSKNEQEKIAEILMKWDEAIELQEKYIEKLKLKRKSMLQKVFPTDKSNTTIKLGDYLIQCTNRNKANIDNVKSVSNIRGFIDQKDQFSKEVASEDLSNYKVVKKGNIAYNPSRINVGSIAIYEDENPGIVSPMYVVFSCNGISPKYLLLLLESCRGKYEIKSYLSGSVRDSLSFEDLCDISLPIPAIAQETIVCAFEEIEKVISHNNDLLQKMIDQRKALQQYLLNGIVRV